MTLKRALLAATVISSISGVAVAQMPLPSLEPAPAFTGLYIGAGVGLNWLQNEHLITSAHDFGFPQGARAGGREFKYGPMVNVLYENWLLRKSPSSSTRNPLGIAQPI